MFKELARMMPDTIPELIALLQERKNDHDALRSAGRGLVAAGAKQAMLDTMAMLSATTATSAADARIKVEALLSVTFYLEEDGTTPPVCGLIGWAARAESTTWNFGA